MSILSILVFLAGFFGLYFLFIVAICLFIKWFAKRIYDEYEE